MWETRIVYKVNRVQWDTRIDATVQPDQRLIITKGWHQILAG